LAAIVHNIQPIIVVIIDISEELTMLYSKKRVVDVTFANRYGRGFYKVLTNKKIGNLLLNKSE